MMTGLRKRIDEVLKQISRVTVGLISTWLFFVKDQRHQHYCQSISKKVIHTITEVISQPVA